ncbi:hypothetical protein FO441_01420 [Salinicoccus cyprini]|uniref:Uncharacterized protein n=1 Tax=Salinicoccus cyprini TaxID=2493691 RepID=A0A558AXH9_9STAP|nr:hypothetical protein [Salinicoccus cyprini]TVT28963.1 hypothetical protein FO441_01420 [Salinicoccus cyprini]
MKMTILWFLFEGFILIFTASEFKKAMDLKRHFKYFVVKTISISALLIIIINTYNFNYFIELILIFMLLCCSFFAGFLRNYKGKKYTRELNFFNLVLSIIGLTLVTFSSIKFVVNFELIVFIDILQEYLMLIVFSIWVIPFIYCLLVYSIYELIWIKLSFYKYIPQQYKNQIKLSVIKCCHINYDKLETFYSDSEWKSTAFNTPKDVEDYFNKFVSRYNQNKKA